MGDLANAIKKATAQPKQPSSHEDEAVEETSLGITSVQGDPAIIVIVTKGDKVIKREVKRLSHKLLARDEFKRKAIELFSAFFRG